MNTDMFDIEKMKVLIPLTNPFPVKTFHSRLLKKWNFMICLASKHWSTKIGLVGAKYIGNTVNGNTLLKLNRNYALGDKGFTVQLPKDKAIFEYIRFQGK